MSYYTQARKLYLKSKASKKLDQDLMKQINRYVQCKLTQGEIDDLWDKLVKNNDAMEYLENRVNLGYLFKHQQLVTDFI